MVVIFIKLSKRLKYVIRKEIGIYKFLFPINCQIRLIQTFKKNGFVKKIIKVDLFSIVRDEKTMASAVHCHSELGKISILKLHYDKAISR